MFPASLLIYEIEKKNPGDFIPVVIGFISSVILCAIKVFFMYSHRIIPFSFSENFVYYFFKLYFLPVIIVFGIFFLLSRDKISYKLDSFFPLISSFYAVYFPYSVISSYSSNVFAGYDIFIKPVVALAMIVSVTVCVKQLFYAVIEKNVVKIVLAFLIFITLFICPAVFDCLYILKLCNFAVLLVFCSLYCAVSVLAVLLVVYNKLKK